MANKKVEELLHYCKQLEGEGLAALGDCLSIRSGEGMFATDPAKQVGQQTEDDVNKYSFSHMPAAPMLALHRELYLARPDVKAIITNHAPYCVAVAARVRRLPAVLDDMAQIIGPFATVASSYAPQNIIRVMGKTDACLVKNGGAVAVGRTPDEAYTGSLVLEKGAKAYIEGEVLGGAIKIPYLEALLMRLVYKKKYSKADQKAKQEELEI